MADLKLIISNPPHHTVNIDAAIPCFDMPAVAVRLKANYAVPEIWFADEDSDRLEGTAKTLRTAGLNVALVASRALATVPGRSIVKTFAFTDEGLVLRSGEENIALSYDAPLLAVFCQPIHYRRSGSDIALRDVVGRRTSGFLAMKEQQPRFSGPTPKDVEEEDPPFVDFYTMQDGAPRRLSVMQTGVDFSGLHMRWRRAADNMLLFLAECQDRFQNAKVDRRLVGLRVRQSVSMTQQAAPASRRHGFSYATIALVRLLESISPDLRGLSDPELSSRLIYLAHVA